MRFARLEKNNKMAQECTQNSVKSPDGKDVIGDVEVNIVPLTKQHKSVLVVLINLLPLPARHPCTLFMQSHCVGLTLKDRTTRTFNRGIFSSIYDIVISTSTF